MHTLKRMLITICMLGMLTAVAHAESGSAVPDEMNGLLKGKDSFFITPPKQWTAQTEDANEKGMYAYFIMDGYTYSTSPGLIYVRVLEKLGLTVPELLKMDMDNTRKQKENVKFEPFAVTGLSYPYAAKKYVYVKKSCDYVCYIDPGKDELTYLIFVLSADQKHCNDYQEVFKDMIRSFAWGVKK